MNAPGAITSPQGINLSCRGHFHLPEAFYGMKIGQLLAEIQAKTQKNVLDRVMKNKGVPLLGEVPLLKNLRYIKREKLQGPHYIIVREPSPHISLRSNVSAIISRHVHPIFMYLPYPHKNVLKTFLQRFFLNLYRSKTVVRTGA